MRNSNRGYSYFFSGNSSIIGSYFHKRTTDYSRFLKNQKPTENMNNTETKSIK